MRTPARLARQLSVPFLLQLQATGRQAYRDWIRQRHYVVQRVISTDSFEIFVHDDFDIAPPFAFELNRCASAAFESVEAISRVPPQPRSTGWLMITLYYAAFFAAHAILRAFGRFCSQVEANDVSTVAKTAFALGVTPALASVSAGLYVATYSPASKLLRADRLTDSHADTWKAFYDLIRSLSVDVLTVPGISAEKMLLPLLSMN
jgi:hypothetical protein